jgi:hypothetical protein
MKFFDLKKKECDILGLSSPENPPCDNTVRNLLQKLKLPLKICGKALQLMFFENLKQMLISKKKRLLLIEYGTAMKWEYSSVI